MSRHALAAIVGGEGKRLDRASNNEGVGTGGNEGLGASEGVEVSALVEVRWWHRTLLVPLACPLWVLLGAG